MKHSEPMGGSADNITKYGSAPIKITMPPKNGKESQRTNKYNSFKSHISHSMGDLNTKVQQDHTNYSV